MLFIYLNSRETYELKIEEVRTNFTAYAIRLEYKRERMFQNYA